MSSGAGFEWSQASAAVPAWDAPARAAAQADGARGGGNPYGSLADDSQQYPDYQGAFNEQWPGSTGAGGEPQPQQQPGQPWSQDPQTPSTPQAPQNPQYPGVPPQFGPPSGPGASLVPATPAAPGAPSGPILPIAQVFDGVNPDGSLVINRTQLDPREIPAVAAYLTQAPIVLSAPGTGKDEMVTAGPPLVPRSFHSDGAWVWPGSVGYYLNQYQLPPQPDLLAYIRARNYALPGLAPGAVQAIGAQVLAALNTPPAPPPTPVQPQAQAQPQPQAMPSALPMPGTGLVAQNTPPPAPSTAVAVPAAPEPSSAFLVGWFSETFNAVGNRHAAWVLEQMETFLAFLVPGEWTADRPNLVFRQPGRQFAVEALGALSGTGVWTWAWSDPATWGADPVAAEQARRLCAYGEAQGIDEFANAALDLTHVAGYEGDARRAADMVAGAAMGALGARGYVGNSPLPEDAQTRVYYLVFDPVVPAAQPTLGTVPQFVMEGPGTFGGDVADCVLGYVEHHGWRWSRLPDGIVVAAEGVGSFTVEIDVDGRLTGLSLHT